MRYIGKISNKIGNYYMHYIVKEQYPMLTPFSRKKLQKEGAIGVVYMLHHITKKNPKGIPTNEDLKISPHFLESLIIKYKKQGFIFISLDELNEIIRFNKNPKHPFIVFTIDDGYLDNYTEALPIFERNNVPFSIFVATDFIDQKAILWWDILEDLILKNDSICIGEKTYQCKSFQKKWDIYRIVRDIILSFNQKDLCEALKQSFSHYDIDWYEPIRRQAMSWEQIRILSQHPLCTIGGHTVSHTVLNQLNEEDFHHEIADCIMKLQTMTEKSIQHFAYPYGSTNEIGEREYNLISKFGFKTVFLAYGGCITEKNKSNLTHLPRIYLQE